MSRFKSPSRTTIASPLFTRIGRSRSLARLLYVGGPFSLALTRFEQRFQSNGIFNSLPSRVGKHRRIVSFLLAKVAWPSELIAPTRSNVTGLDNVIDLIPLLAATVSFTTSASRTNNLESIPELFATHTVRYQEETSKIELHRNNPRRTRG